MELENHGINRDQVSIEITNEDNLVSSIKEKMEQISLPHCICRVPEELFKGSEENYYPSVVSIGPFHRGKDILQDMQDHKWRYCNTLLGRKPNSDVLLERCVKALRHVEQKARKLYTENISMDSDQFVEMMLLDGCFIIELFLENAFKSLRRRDDPCFGPNNLIFKLRCDLILLENQVPFFVLDQLFHIVPIPKQCNFTLIEIALFFFKNLIPQDYSPPKPLGLQTDHLLDLIRQHYLPTLPLPLPKGLQTRINPATQLRTQGIKVKRAIDETPSNIRFLNGELEIPPLKIHAYTQVLFRNIIAMELCNPKCPKHVTSYVVLMEGLIQTKRDLRFLQDKDILVDGHDRKGENWFLFKKMNVEINVKDSYYRGLCERVNGYQGRKRRVCWENVKHAYHRTRFGIAGFSLAMFILVFLVTGALFVGLYYVMHHFQ